MTHWGDEDRDFFDTEPDDGAFYGFVFVLAVLTLIFVGLTVT